MRERKVAFKRSMYAVLIVPPSLCLLQQGLHLTHGTLNDTALNGDDSFASVLFDYLSHQDAIPRPPTRTPSLPRMDGLPKDRANGLDVRPAAIHTQQQGTAQSSGTDMPHQRRDQGCIAAGTEHPIQP